MIKWVITEMESIQTSGKVFMVHWLAYIMDEEAKKGVPHYGSVKLNSESDEFIPYETLTEETVLQWVWSLVDKAEIENKLKDTLNDKVVGTVTSGLPWKEYIPSAGA
jgi:hypothetical protein